MDCHGNATRPLRIYAEQRFRLNVEWLDFETPITTEEISANFTAVRGFLGRGSETNLLSEKPLDVRAGGLFHGADGLYGPGDVFLESPGPWLRDLATLWRGCLRERGLCPGPGVAAMSRQWAIRILLTLALLLGLAGNASAFHEIESFTRTESGGGRRLVLYRFAPI